MSRLPKFDRTRIDRRTTLRWLAATMAAGTASCGSNRGRYLGDEIPPPPATLLGDAARVVHPLAGLGVNIGFEDVRGLLEVLERSAVGGDPGASGLWTEFARRRRTRARSITALMTAMRWMYSRGDPLSQWLRNVGVRAVDGSGALKGQLIREALGLGSVARSS